MAKKTFAVGILGATTVCFSKEKRIGFLTPTGIIYWLDLEDRRDCQGLRFSEGELVWIYVIQELCRVLSVVEFGGEKLEDMPPAEPVEVDV